MRCPGRRFALAALVSTAGTLAACGSSPAPTRHQQARPGYSQQLVVDRGIGRGDSILGAVILVGADPSSCHIRWHTYHPVGPERDLVLGVGASTTITTSRCMHLTLERTVTGPGRTECTFAEDVPPVPGH